ncbi:hypothetical protein [Polycladidibacter hongkongensis]|uniref:hypothetical protein n=1 Tax=Polycladidibacter hongkongensis TaxID=1647556 RepID=UPI0012E3A012|nr:hypothetical protein [Pseudovibrio hongkongensis]
MPCLSVERSNQSPITTWAPLTEVTRWCCNQKANVPPQEYSAAADWMVAIAKNDPKYNVPELQ